MSDLYERRHGLKIQKLGGVGLVMVFGGQRCGFASAWWGFAVSACLGSAFGIDWNPGQERTFSARVCSSYRRFLV